MGNLLKLDISYEGKLTDEHKIDLYDVAQALMGFHRSLAITTHLILNQEIITQAPALKNAEIVSYPSEEGSWKMTVGVLLVGGYNVVTLDNSSPLGHLVFSAYDYIVAQSLGFHVDYDKSLGKLYEEDKNNKLPIIKEHQLDSVIEKVQTSLKEMHRPIYSTETASRLKIIGNYGDEDKPLSSIFTRETYNYIREEKIKNDTVEIEGLISSYNINTGYGRIYVSILGRTVPFELQNVVLNNKDSISGILQNMQSNALRNKNDEIEKIKMLVMVVLSSNEKIKRYIVKEIIE